MKSREIAVSLFFVYRYSRWISIIIISFKNILVNDVRTPLRTFCECDLKFSARIASVDTLDSNFDNSTCVTVESGGFLKYECTVNLAAWSQQKINNFRKKKLKKLEIPAYYNVVKLSLEFLFDIIHEDSNAAMEDSQLPETADWFRTVKNCTKYNQTARKKIKKKLIFSKVAVWVYFCVLAEVKLHFWSCRENANVEWCEITGRSRKHAEICARRN